MYAFFYPQLSLQSAFFNTACKKYLTLTYNGIKYKDQTLIYVTNNSFINDSTSRDDLTPRPVMIKHFIVHCYQSENTVFEHVFAG